MTILLVFIGASVAGVIIGFLLGRLFPVEPHASESAESDRLRRQVAEMTRQLKEIAEQRATDSAFAARIPYIVKLLGEKQSAGALPPIAVRIAMDMFHPAAVGFFAPVRETEEVALVEGTGFPPDWKGNRTFSSAAGMLGAAFARRIIVLKEDFTALAANLPSSPSSLESAGVMADIVAPVASGGRTYGAIVMAGLPARTGKERLYASMFADLVANAFLNATTVESADHKASTDHLTGLFNRGYFAPRFETEMRRAKSYSLPISFVMFDIDRFKSVNDTYGHHAGDVVLKRIAEVARDLTRSSDVVVRYGGEEFAILMTTSDKEQAYVHAERLREVIADTAFRLPGRDEPIRVTISGGVATFPEDGDTTVELIHAADKALYEAKNRGRNRIVSAFRTGLDGQPY